MLTRWVMDRGDRLDPLPIVAPAGPAVTFAERLLDVWADDLAVRQHHTGREQGPRIEVVPFPEPVQTWPRSGATATLWSKQVRSVTNR